MENKNLDAPEARIPGTSRLPHELTSLVYGAGPARLTDIPFNDVATPENLIEALRIIRQFQKDLNEILPEDKA